MELSAVLLLNKNFSFHMNGEEGFLMDFVDGDVYEINSTTKYILESCNGVYTLAEISQILCGICEIDKAEITEEDILEMAEYFVANNICKII